MKFKIFNKYLVFITIISNILINHSYSSEHEEVCDNKVINHIVNYADDEHFQYLEKRKDTGLFFDFKWNSENEEIIIKRDKNNYPILRFSLFEKEKLISGSIIKKINSNDLSKLNDNQIKKITRIDDVLNIELTNNENVLIFCNSCSAMELL